MPCARPASKPGWRRCPTGSTRLSARTAWPCPVASAGAWRWPARCWQRGPVLVLDEPTSGLDPALADELMAGVLAAAGERSVLVITHRAAEAELCDVVVTLEAGRVVPPRA